MMFFVKKILSLYPQASNHSPNLLLVNGRYLNKKQFQSHSTFQTLHAEKNKKEIVSYTENDRGETLAIKTSVVKSTQITQLLVAAKSKKSRYSKQLILVEGKRLIAEALKAHVKPVIIAFSRKNLIEGLPLNSADCSPTNTILRQMPYKELALWSDLTTSPGIFGIFKMPNLEKRDPPADKLPITMVCDNVREPGNLGSILRISAALPVERVILVTGCTDLWDPKVIRSSSGAMFYLNLTINASWDDVNDLCNGKVLIADHLQNQKSDTCTLMRSENIYGEPDIPFEEDCDDTGNQSLRETYSLPVKSCFDSHVDSSESFVIIVGGETHGLSENAFQLASLKNGYRVNIPLAKCVDSLNAGAALGIISFELKKQMMSC